MALNPLSSNPGARKAQTTSSVDRINRLMRLMLSVAWTRDVSQRHCRGGGEMISAQTLQSVGAVRRVKHSRKVDSLLPRGGWWNVASLYSR